MTRLTKSLKREWYREGAMASSREAFGEVLCELGRIHDGFTLFTADLSGGTGAKPFRDAYPDRTIEFGVAEQNMVVAAGGYASCGVKIPLVTTFAGFLMRAYEPLIIAVAYPNRDVKFVCSHGGVDTGPDGATAQALWDISALRAVPNMTIVVPACANEVMHALPHILDHRGPVYMRVIRSPSPVVVGSDYIFRIGKAQRFREGTDVTIIATGVMVHRSISAADMLKDRGVSVRVVNLSTLKPIDVREIVSAANETGCIVTAEDHGLGGLASAVSEVVTSMCPVPMEFVRVNDKFGKSGEPDELANIYHLNDEYIVEAVQRVIARK